MKNCHSKLNGKTATLFLLALLMGDMNDLLDRSKDMYREKLSFHSSTEHRIVTKCMTVTSASSDWTAVEGGAGLYSWDVKIISWRTNVKLISNKLRNRGIRAINGNRVNRMIVKLAHWNAGSCFWQNKQTQIEAMLLDKTPNLVFISEVNLLDTVPDYERHLDGYSMHLPNTMSKHTIARIVLLVKMGIEVSIHREYMHEDVAAIWASVKNGGKKVMMIGGVYREHQMLLKQKPNPTLLLAAQLECWNLFLKGWKRAARRNMCVLIGDTNLDFARWQNPEESHKKMVDRMKEVMETEGFIQVIKGITRMWPGQVDSLVDQCWLNMPQRLFSHTNETRGSSDHNFISVLLRTKERNLPAQEMRKRQWSLFNPATYREKISRIDWTSFYSSQNLDILNTIFEENVGRILESEAPMRNIQRRKSHRNWVDADIKTAMRLRDLQRDKAKITDDNYDWISYRRMRNDCSKLLKR